jgi:hypothetical protein
MGNTSQSPSLEVKLSSATAESWCLFLSNENHDHVRGRSFEGLPREFFLDVTVSDSPENVFLMSLNTRWRCGDRWRMTMMTVVVVVDGYNGGWSMDTTDDGRWT